MAIIRPAPAADEPGGHFSPAYSFRTPFMALRSSSLRSISALTPSCKHEEQKGVDIAMALADPRGLLHGMDAHDGIARVGIQLSKLLDVFLEHVDAHLELLRVGKALVGGARKGSVRIGHILLPPGIEPVSFIQQADVQNPR